MHTTLPISHTWSHVQNQSRDPTRPRKEPDHTDPDHDASPGATGTTHNNTRDRDTDITLRSRIRLELTFRTWRPILIYFKTPLRTTDYGSIAQWSERFTNNKKVAGSNPWLLLTLILQFCATLTTCRRYLLSKTVIQKMDFILMDTTRDIPRHDPTPQTLD